MYQCAVLIKQIQSEPNWITLSGDKKFINNKIKINETFKCLNVRMTNCYISARQSEGRYSLRDYFMFSIAFSVQEKRFKRIEKEILSVNPRLCHVLHFRDTKTGAEYLSIHVKQGQPGLSKASFTSDRYTGKRVIDDLKLGAKSINSVTSKQIIKNFQNLELIHGDSAKLNAFIASRVKPKKISRLEEHKIPRCTKEELVKEVISGSAVGNIHDVKDFYEDNLGDVSKLIEITHLKFCKQIGKSQMVQLSAIEQLQSFLEKARENDEMLMSSNQQMIDSRYQDVVDSLFKVIFRKCESKMNAVWLFGDPDTGKTTIARILEQIFITERFQESSSQFQVSTGRTERKPSIIIMNEINHRQFFSKKNIAVMKSFLEGEGYPINRKFEDPEVKYQRCQVYITSNSLPFNSMSEIDTEAFLTRITLIELQKGIRDSGKPFPFTAIHLAQYFYQRLLSDGDIPGEAGETFDGSTVDNNDDGDDSN